MSPCEHVVVAAHLQALRLLRSRPFILGPLLSCPLCLHMYCTIDATGVRHQSSDTDSPRWYLAT